MLVLSPEVSHLKLSAEPVFKEPSPNCGPGSVTVSEVLNNFNNEKKSSC